MRNIETLQSDHEEADSRMFIYARYLVTNNHIGPIIIATFSSLHVSTLLNHLFHAQNCGSKQEMSIICVTLLSMIYVKNMVLPSACLF